MSAAPIREAWMGPMSDEDLAGIQLLADKTGSSWSLAVKLYVEGHR